MGVNCKLFGRCVPLKAFIRHRRALISPTTAMKYDLIVAPWADVSQIALKELGVEKQDSKGQRISSLVHP
jgi:hypothetical protein